MRLGETGRAGLSSPRALFLLGLLAAAVAVAAFLAFRGPWRKPPAAGSGAGPAPAAMGPSGASPEEVEDRALRDEQLQAARKLLEAFPGNDDATFLAGIIHYEQGDSAKAIELWELSVKLDPTRADAYERLGYATLLREDRAKAMASYQKAHELDPKLEEPPLRIAQIHVDQGKPREAAEILEKAGLRSPQAHRLLGQAYQQLKDFERARQSFEAAVALKPDFAEAYYGLAVTCSRLGDQDKAREYRNKFDAFKTESQTVGRRMRSEFNPLAVTRQSVSHTHTDVGRVYRSQGKVQEAEKLWRRAAELDPKNADPRVHLAALYQQARRDPEALKMYEEATKADPQNGPALFNLGNMYARLKRSDEAETAFRKVIQVSPERSEGYHALARLLLLRGKDLPEAVTLAESAVRLAPVAQNYAILGQAHARNGDLASASAALEKAVELDSGNPEYKRLLQQLGSAK